MFYMKVKLRVKNKILKALDERVKFFRIKAKMTQESLAFKIDVDRTYVGAIEQGLRSPSIYCFYQLSLALGIELKDLAEFKIENEHYLTTFISYKHFNIFYLVVQKKYG